MTISFAGGIMKTMQLVVMSLLVWPVIAYGEEESEAEIDESAVAAISEGEMAPFAGMLFPTELAIQMGFRIENLQLRLRIDVDRERNLCQVHRNYDANVLRLEQARRDYEVELLTERVEQQAEQLARPIPFYKSWSFAFSMGIVASVLLVVGGVALIVAVT
jgi:hypothetical protein